MKSYQEHGKNLDQMSRIFDKRFFNLPLPVQTIDVLPLGTDTDHGFITQAYRISETAPSYRGACLKVFDHNNPEYLIPFARNIAILQELAPMYINSLKAGEPVIPYVLASGTYQDKPACIETMMPNIKGASLDSILEKLEAKDVKYFCLNLLNLLSMLEQQGVVQIEPKLANIGRNPITGKASMIDFGNAYSEETHDWSTNPITWQDALDAGIATYTHEIGKVTAKFSELKELTDKISSLPTMKQISYSLAMKVLVL